MSGIKAFVLVPVEIEWNVAKTKVVSIVSYPSIDDVDRAIKVHYESLSTSRGSCLDHLADLDELYHEKFC